jgi:HAD superfamily hydrolase (TIGR01509 family)
MTNVSAPLFKAIIFDADGTLVDTERTTLEVLYEQACAHGLRMDRAEANQRFRGRRMAWCVQDIESCTGRTLPKDFIDTVRDAMAVRFEQGVSLMPGARELVQTLHERQHVPYCIATNGPRSKVTQTLTMSGLMPYFEGRIFCAYEVGSFKPEPGLFVHAAQAMGQAPSSCCVVEDSLPGVQAGLAAGMQVFYVGDITALPMPLHTQVRRLDSLSRLQPLIKRQSVSC